METLLKRIFDFYLKFQYDVCDVKSRSFLPNRGFYVTCLLLSFLFDTYVFVGVYLFLMIFCMVTVIFGKLFPKFIGIPLAGFFKKYSSPEVFKNYCGNPLGAITGGVVKIAGTSGGRVAIAAAGILITQDAVHKSGIGQYSKYQIEKWSNDGSHPSNKPFTFKNNGPSWADNVSNLPGKKN